ncbi:MAG TPA: FecR domain-containing protein [Polyangia bacterium]|nr:FecR domain-containing protein [Polyangia bacterium]
MNAELESVLADVGRTVTAEARRRQLVPEIQARLAHFESRRARPRGWSLALGLGLCGAAAAVLMLRPHPLSFAIAGTAGNGQLGVALVAPSAQPLELRFSDGSAVTLPPRAAAHVDALDGQGATLAIEDGTLEVSVVHRARTHWQVQAGGYRIQVTGTRFAAGWDRRSQSLTVSMHEGSVLVSGPGLKEPVRVVTGQRLQASAGGANLGFEAPHEIAAREEMPPLPDLSGAEAAPPALAPVPLEIPATPAEHAPARARHPEALASHAVPALPADWRIQAGRAQYHEALAAAVLEGWRAECGRLGADDLVLLGDVARLAGDLNRAEEAYRSARRRFPQADRPTFALGLIAFEGRHDYRAAGDWFASYLRSFPRGPLAREAAGRLIESRIKAGDDGQARDAATSYLRAFPDGPHAALARRTVTP